MSILRSREVEEPLLVELTHVADGEVVAAPVGRGLVGIALVRELPHQLEVHGADGARGELVAVVVEDLDAGARPRRADGARVRQPVLRLGQRAAALGRAVELVDDRPQPVEQAALQVDRTRRRGVDDLPQRRHVVPGAHVLGERHEPVQLGRHHGDVGDAVLVDQLQRALGVPLLHEHDLVLEVQREVAERQRRQVVHRRRDEVHRVTTHLDVVAREVGAVRRHPGLGVELRQVALHRLRTARRARRVLHELARHPVVGRGVGPAGEQVRQRGETGDLAADGDAARRGHARGLGRLAGDVTERGVGHEGRGARVGEDVADLVGGEVGVQPDVLPAALEDGEERLEQLGRVPGERGDGVERLDAPRARSACTSWFAPASSSPAVHCRPSASTSAIRSGSSRAATQNPLGCSPTTTPSDADGSLAGGPNHTTTSGRPDQASANCGSHSAVADTISSVIATIAS